MANMDNKYCSVCDNRAYYDADICEISPSYAEAEINGAISVLCSHCVNTHDLVPIPKKGCENAKLPADSVQTKWKSTPPTENPYNLAVALAGVKAKIHRKFFRYDENIRINTFQRRYAILKAKAMKEETELFLEANKREKESENGMGKQFY
jgi:hypothetical protein